jgi:hypothetical protein
VSESALQSAVIAALRRIGCHVLVNRAGHRGKVPVRASHGKGAPDLEVWCGAGVVAYLETKAPKTGRLSPAQREWHAKAYEYGLEVYVVTSVAQAVRIAHALRRRHDAPNALPGSAPHAPTPPEARP